MNPVIKFCLEVLSGNILFNGEVVKVIKRGYPLDKSPCITLDDSGGTSLLTKDLINLDLPLSRDHPQYDSQNPQKLFAQEVVRSKYMSTVNINVWCDSENQREAIDNRVKELFYMAFTDNYYFCSNYNNETEKCSTLDTKCPAMTNTDGKSAKRQCPQAELYGYQNLFSKLDCDKYTFSLDEPFSMDDISMKPRVLRSIHRLNLNYYRNYVVGGNVLTNYEIEL